MQKYHAIADVLLDLEVEMRKYGLWSTTKPSEKDLLSIQPFCIDTLSFSEWTQYIFVPHMKQIIEQGHQLPSCSDIAPMAEVSFKLTTRRTDTILELLIECDRLTSEAVG